MLVGPDGMSIDRIGAVVSTSAATSLMRLGVYEDDGGGQPGNLLVDAGTVDTSTTGLKEIVIAETLTAGIWWLAGVTQTQTATFRAITNLQMPVPVGLFNPASDLSQAALVGYYKTAVTGALPDPHDTGWQRWRRPSHHREGGMNTTVTTYGPGGFDPDKPDGNVVSSRRRSPTSRSNRRQPTGSPTWKPPSVATPPPRLASPPANPRRSPPDSATYPDGATNHRRGP